jgi:hypothetical protein
MLPHINEKKKRKKQLPSIEMIIYFQPFVYGKWACVKLLHIIFEQQSKISNYPYDHRPVDILKDLIL